MEVMLIGGLIGTIAVVLVIAVGILFMKDRIASVEGIDSNRATDAISTHERHDRHAANVPNAEVSPQSR
jgi:hypothetical protein